MGASQRRYDHLARATSVEEVVSITRDYLAGWSAAELEGLPDRCRPAWVRSPADVERWADLFAEEMGVAMLDPEDERRLDRLASHFLIAAVRIRTIEQDREPLRAAA